MSAAPPAQPHPVVSALDHIHATPLRQIPTELADAVVRRVLRRREKDPPEPVEVATFGSCI